MILGKIGTTYPRKLCLRHPYSVKIGRNHYSRKARDHYSRKARDHYSKIILDHHTRKEFVRDHFTRKAHKDHLARKVWDHHTRKAFARTTLLGKLLVTKILSVKNRDHGARKVPFFLVHKHHGPICRPLECRQNVRSRS